MILGIFLYVNLKIKLICSQSINVIPGAMRIFGEIESEFFEFKFKKHISAKFEKILKIENLNFFHDLR
jgi:hypothetical protein